MAKLYFYYSAMNAGKTTNLLQSAYNYAERGMRTLILTPQLDDRYGQGVVWENLLPVGSHRRNWKQTLVSDGFLMVRHPTWGGAMTLANAAAEDVTLYAS